MSNENMAETPETAQEAHTAPETPSEGNHTSEVENGAQEANESVEKSTGTKFSREYVEDLRNEAAKYRTRAKKVEGLEKRLHDALVKLDGRLQDASDLQFDPDRLEEEGGIEDAITALIENKPHLAKRTPKGNVGAGIGDTDGTPDLISLMRGL